MASGAAGSAGSAGETKRVRVTLSDGREVELEDTPADMVEFVCEEAATLSAATFGTLTVDVNEGDIKPKFERRWAARKRKK